MSSSPTKIGLLIGHITFVLCISYARASHGITALSLPGTPTPTEQVRHKSAFSVLHVSLAPGVSIKAEAGCMLCMENAEIRSVLGGPTSWKTGQIGCLSSLGRALFGGQSLFINHFVGGPGQGGWVWLAPPGPGDICVLDVAPDQEIFIQRGSFLGSWTNVETSLKSFGLKGLFSGEGMFFLRAYCADAAKGKVYVCSYGSIEKFTITKDQELTVDTGHVVAFESSLTFTLEALGNYKELLVSGEGLVCKFKLRDLGPRTRDGCVWIQTRKPPPSGTSTTSGR